MDGELAFFVLVGLFGQLVDGALGMAYGLTCTSVLLAQGISPAAASAAVHSAEVFTSAASGGSHLLFGNVDKRLFWRLALPGALGGVLGATALAQLPGELLRPWILGYLLIMGALVVARAFGRRLQAPSDRGIPALGLIAGALDAMGGGGWGPLASSTLLARGGQARFVIGSVNAAEFVVTLATTGAFVTSLGLGHGKIVLGLIIGGVLAAPLSAWLVRFAPHRPMMIAVGLLIIALALIGLLS